ncbi:hypothetical protein D3C86_2017480 [compost metagenome]
MVDVLRIKTHQLSFGSRLHPLDGFVVVDHRGDESAIPLILLVGIFFRGYPQQFLIVRVVFDAKHHGSTVAIVGSFANLLAVAKNDTFKA